MKRFALTLVTAIFALFVTAVVAASDSPGTDDPKIEAPQAREEIQGRNLRENDLDDGDRTPNSVETKNGESEIARAINRLADSWLESNATKAATDSAQENGLTNNILLEYGDEKHERTEELQQTLNWFFDFLFVNEYRRQELQRELMIVKPLRGPNMPDSMCLKLMGF